jgi:drug/metabolite transporter (DMT)-like permease
LPRQKTRGSAQVNSIGAIRALRIAAGIFCTEPVFAAGYAWFAINERLDLFGLAGALLILGGMVVSIIAETSGGEEVAMLEEYRAGE